MSEKKPIKKAAALTYNVGESTAPKVVAIGKGDIAEKIVEKAMEAGVPIVEDPHLADALTALKIGSEIPRELYEVVAEVLAFISRVDKRYQSSKFAQGGEK